VGGPGKTAESKVGMEGRLGRVEACFKAVGVGHCKGKPLEDVFDAMQTSVMEKVRQVVNLKADFDASNVSVEPLDRGLVERVSDLENEAKAVVEEIEARKAEVAENIAMEMKREWSRRDEEWFRIEEAKPIAGENPALLVDEAAKLALLHALLSEHKALKDSLCEMTPEVSRRLSMTIQATLKGNALKKSEVDEILSRSISDQLKSSSDKIDVGFLLARRVAAQMGQKRQSFHQNNAGAMTPIKERFFPAVDAKPATPSSTIQKRNKMEDKQEKPMEKKPEPFAQRDANSIQDAVVFGETFKVQVVHSNKKRGRSSSSKKKTKTPTKRRRSSMVPQTPQTPSTPLRV